MTPEQAIAAIKGNWPDEYYLTLREALTVAIAALTTPAAPPGDEPPVTAYRYAMPDDEGLPLLLCACGQGYAAWEQTIGVEAEYARPMPCCGRRLYWRQRIDVLEAPA